MELQSTVNTPLINSVRKSTKKAYDTGLKTFIQFLLLQGLAFDCSKFRDGNSPRFSIRKIFHLNPELEQIVQKSPIKCLKQQNIGLCLSYSK